MQPEHIGSVSEYLQPIRTLTELERGDVACELSGKIRATTMMLTTMDGGDSFEIKHADLARILYGLSEDARLLDDVLRNTEVAQ